MFHEIWPIAVLGVALVVAAVTDIRSGKIPNYVTYPAVLIGLAGHTLLGGLWGAPDGDALGLMGALTGLAVGFVPLLLAWLTGGIGGGDAKLMAAVGTLTGWRFALAAMLYGFIVAAMMAIVVMIHRRVAKDTFKRVWRFVALALFYKARPGDPSTKDSPKIAFGVALCIGSAFAVLEWLLRGPGAGSFMLGI